MALPEHVLSTSLVYGQYLSPDSLDPQFAFDRELGGIHVSDTSEGLQYQVWTSELRFGVNYSCDIYLSAPNTPAYIVYSGDKITTAALAFDQNMKPAFAFMQDGVAKLWWYDTTILSYDVIELPAGSTTPKVCLDDKRSALVSTSDLLLTYVRAGVLYYREQRDRFLIEYTLATGLIGEVLQFGMTIRNRVQWAIGLVDAPVGQNIHRAETAGRRRITTQGNLRKVVGVSYG